VPTTSEATRRSLPTGLIDLADPDRPPHPGGRPCGALCVPACTRRAADHIPSHIATRGSAAVDIAAHIDLTRIHHAELRQAADDHRLASAVRSAKRPRRPRLTHLLAGVTRPKPRRLRGDAEAEPCPP
jgi:hypothetical protein